ncbi:MAG: amidase [Chloroflexi bacterium]|nr:amidase [Chloroflexota bacterium]MBM4450360.1 amidase [Chloroflexota bacterium]
MTTDKAYDLESVKLPSLTGGQLKFFAGALENSAMRGILLPSLLKSGGFDEFRKMAPDEPPTFLPLAFTAKAAKEAPDIQALNNIAGTKAKGFPYQTAKDYAEAYRTGKTTPVEVARKILDAIKESDRSTPPLRAFIAINEKNVIEQAEASARRWKSGKPISPLDGVPVAVKDEVDMVPYPTTVGTNFLGKTPAKEDSTVVARIRAAGALLIGKANMHEIGINPNGLNVHYGHVRNPHDLKHDSGGSSSGPAAAVAAGLCPVSIGADGGGSIRIPSAHCGIVGLKPTFGRVSELGAAPLCWSVAHLGPIGASVEDIALAYAAIAGPDSKDPNSQHQPAVGLDGWNKADLRDLTLGIYHPWFNHTSASVIAACQAMLDKLAKAGARIKEITIPGLDAMRMAHVVTILAEMVTSMDNFPQNRGDFAASVRINLVLGRAFTGEDYVKAQRLRTRAIATFNQVLKDVDAIITPATAMTAPLIPGTVEPIDWSDLSSTTEVMRFAFPGNLTGLPAISFPSGYDEKGLPIGMQAMGRHWEEHLLLRIAYAAEQVMERKKPAMHFKILE